MLGLSRLLYAPSSARGCRQPALVHPAPLCIALRSQARLLHRNAIYQHLPGRQVHIHTTELDLLDIDGRLLVLDLHPVCSQLSHPGLNASLIPRQLCARVKHGTQFRLEVPFYIGAHPLQWQLLQCQLKLAALDCGLTLHFQLCKLLGLGFTSLIQACRRQQLQGFIHGPRGTLDLHRQRCHGQLRHCCPGTLIPPVHDPPFNIKLLQAKRQGWRGFLSSGIGRCLIQRLSRPLLHSFDFRFRSGLTTCTCWHIQPQPVDNPLSIAAGMNFRLDPAHRLQCYLALQGLHIVELQLQRLKTQQRIPLSILQRHITQSQLATDAHHRLLLIFKTNLQVRIQHA